MNWGYSILRWHIVPYQKYIVLSLGSCSRFLQWSVYKSFLVLQINWRAKRKKQNKEERLFDIYHNVMSIRSWSCVQRRRVLQRTPSAKPWVCWECSSTCLRMSVSHHSMTVKYNIGSALYLFIVNLLIKCSCLFGNYTLVAK